jgi:hypothetical protein
MRTLVFIDPTHNTAQSLNIKLMPCPHCGSVDMLIFHGYIYRPSDYRIPIIKGRRIFCSNRNRRTGCGRTVTLFFYDFIKQRLISTRLFWHFLYSILAGYSIEKAYNTIDPSCPLSLSTFYRLWHKFKCTASHIRTFLTDNYPHISLEEDCAYRETIRHLSEVFNDTGCDPIAEYQLSSQKSFI